ncbi:MAG: DNA primase [Hydrogenovibrio sp.]|nr:DNA primase [Hydrogenovibrio sp.]
MTQSKKGSIPRSFIEDLLARSDIVQVIGQRVPLKKAGATYKACCPFHSEKTPSFNVNPQKQFYHCFGCGASGDALKFLTEYDGLSFVEAVEQLAAMNGMEVPREKLSPKAQAQQEKAKTLYDVTHAVAKYYRQQLKDHPQSEQAKLYLKNRGLTSEIAKTFVIGYAPPGWENLTSGLKADPQLKEQLVESGMLIRKEDGRTYDRFRNRIMFPIRDGRGRVVAFGGRVISSEDQPKYLNSPETPIFHKTYTLYGLYEMRQSRQAFDHVIVVEGYMDVVALAQFGIRNAVATLGTAITAEHLDILFRQVNEVVFCFDGDEAGKKAAWKALELALPLLTETRTVKFLFLAQGEDPDSTVRKEGVDGFQRRVDTAMSISSFLFSGLISRLSMPISTIEGQQQLISLSKPYIAQAQGAMPDLLTKVLSEHVDLPVWRLGQIMGLRIASTRKFESRKNNTPTTLKPKSIVLQLASVLFRRPYWAKVYDAEFLEALGGSEKLEYRFFAQMLVVLKEQGYLLDGLKTWLSEPNRQKVLDQISAIPTNDDETFLRAQQEQVTMQIVEDLANEQATKRVRDVESDDKEAMREWFELQKALKHQKP